jgi:hypothetical protein
LVIAEKELELFATGKHEHPHYIQRLLTDVTGNVTVNVPVAVSSPKQTPRNIVDRPLSIAVTTGNASSPLSPVIYSTASSPGNGASFVFLQLAL